MKTSAIKDKMIGVCDTVSRKGNTVTIRQGYFYGMSKSGEHLANAAKRLIPGITNIEYGNKWKSFRGGDSVAQGSHYWCRFDLPVEVTTQAA